MSGPTQQTRRDSVHRLALPRVTVIMPVRDEGAFIDESLGSVLAQDYPPEQLQVLVVDGRSKDTTAERARALLRRHGDIEGLLLDNPHGAAPHALNVGLGASDGDVVVRIDGHCRIPSDYLARCVDLLQRTGADCAGGRLDTVGETLKARGIARAQSSSFGVGNAAFRTGSRSGSYVDTIAFGAYRKDVFERIGGFDEELLRNQDDEFNHRLIQSGGKIWMDPTLFATYYSRADFGSLWRQYSEYGAYKIRVMQKRRSLASWRHLIPAAFVIILTSTVVLAAATGNAIWLAAAAGPYAVANVVASLWATRDTVTLLPYASFGFVILHLAYGTGFLWGLWRWRR